MTNIYDGGCGCSNFNIETGRCIIKNNPLLNDNDGDFINWPKCENILTFCSSWDASGYLDDNNDNPFKTHPIDIQKQSRLIKKYQLEIDKEKVRKEQFKNESRIMAFAFKKLFNELKGKK